MSKSYKVVPGMLGYLILRQTKNLNGDVIKVEISDSFSSREEANAKCRLANYIALKAQEACRKLEVVR